MFALVTPLLLASCQQYPAAVPRAPAHDPSQIFGHGVAYTRRYLTAEQRLDQLFEQGWSERDLADQGHLALTDSFDLTATAGRADSSSGDARSDSAGPYTLHQGQRTHLYLYGMAPDTCMLASLFIEGAVAEDVSQEWWRSDSSVSWARQTITHTTGTEDSLTWLWSGKHSPDWRWKLSSLSDRDITYRVSWHADPADPCDR